MSRLFQPKEEQIIYHYCSAETLPAILESRKLRFTDINMLNDAQESLCGYSAFEEAATRLLKRVDLPESIPKMTRAFFDSVDEVLSRIQLIAHPFVSCFSLDGDSLGQWRAYADDGRGFAIGYRAAMLQHLPVAMLAVEYDREQQIREMMAALIALFLRKSSESPAEQDKFFEDCVLTATYMVGFKHNAFYYEQEVRCLHAVSLKHDGESLHFADPGGGNSGGHQFSGSPIAFHVRDNNLTAYVDIPFWLPSGTSPIAEIVLGPKNYSKIGNVMLYLGGKGYSNIQVRQSKAPYR